MVVIGADAFGRRILVEERLYVREIPMDIARF